MAHAPEDDFGFSGQHGFETRESFIAQKVFLYVTQALSDYPGLAQNAKFDAVREAHIANMVMRITTWCVTGRIDDSVTPETVNYPDGVWQMFKHLHMPHWFVRRFPVRMVSKVIEKNRSFYFVCPHLVTDPQGMHVQFMATGTRQAGRMRT